MHYIFSIFPFSFFFCNSSFIHLLQPLSFQFNLSSPPIILFYFFNFHLIFFRFLKNFHYIFLNSIVSLHSTFHLLPPFLFHLNFHINFFLLHFHHSLSFSNFVSLLVDFFFFFLFQPLFFFPTNGSFCYCCIILIIYLFPSQYQKKKCNSIGIS